MGIRDRPIARGSSWQNGIAERLIGTLRCGLLRSNASASGFTEGYPVKARHPNGLATSRPSRSLADYITNTSGYDFRKGHLCVPKTHPY
jgi:hypothetical protein